MSYELKNKFKGPSTLIIIDGASPTLNLVDFSANTARENVNALVITSVKWSTNSTVGQVDVFRGATRVLKVFGSGYWQHDEMPIANLSTSSVTASVTNGGTAIITIAKRATYNVDTQQI